VQSAPLTFDAIISGLNQVPFGFIELSSNGCAVNETGIQSDLYGDVSINCTYQPNQTNSQHVQVLITFENPTLHLNNTNVQLQLLPVASQRPFTEQSQTIIFKSKLIGVFDSLIQPLVNVAH